MSSVIGVFCRGCVWRGRSRHTSRHMVAAAAAAGFFASAATAALGDHNVSLPPLYEKLSKLWTCFPAWCVPRHILSTKLYKSDRRFLMVIDTPNQLTQSAAQLTRVSDPHTTTQAHTTHTRTTVFFTTHVLPLAIQFPSPIACRASVCSGAHSLSLGGSRTLFDGSASPTTTTERSAVDSSPIVSRECIKMDGGPSQNYYQLSTARVEKKRIVKRTTTENLGHKNIVREKNVFNKINIFWISAEINKVNIVTSRQLNFWRSSAFVSKSDQKDSSNQSINQSTGSLKQCKRCQRSPAHVVEEYNYVYLNPQALSGCGETVETFWKNTRNYKLS